jgi:hypothetical protein
MGNTAIAAMAAAVSSFDGLCDEADHRCGLAVIVDSQR